MDGTAIEPAAEAYDFPLLIKHLLNGARGRAGDRPIVYGDRVRYGYAMLEARLAGLAGALAGLGVGPGDTVAVMDWDSHRYLECFFAVPMMGAVLQTVNVRLSPEQILYTLNHAGAGTLLVHADFLPLLAGIRDRLEHVRRVVLIDDGQAPPAAGVDVAGGYEALLAEAPAAYAFPDFAEIRRATTFYTTGTTGLPKAVYFSHRQLVLHTLAQCAALGTAGRQGRIHRDDVYMPITPMFHVHAWGFPYAATMLGLKQVYPGRYLPDRLLALIRDEQVTFSHCVPTILQMLLAHPQAADIELSGWKVVVGGSALPQALARQALARGIDVFVGYGMSETCPILTLAQVPSARLDEPAEATLPVRLRAGLPMPLVDLRVVDDAMADVPPGGGSGEVVARAPWLTQGYLGNAEASDRLWAGGYLHTGDIGRLEADGGLVITDRLKDVIKTGGEWVSSIELEDLIAQHEGVAEVAVIGVPDPRWGERPVALVVPKPALAATLDAAAIADHVRNRIDAGALSKIALPERILLVEALDKTSVGKLDKKALRARYGSL